MSEKKLYHVKRIYINGVPRRVVADPSSTLLEVIREQQKMTGTKRGCNCGQCGACNVILNGRVARACITRWKQVEPESDLITIEGVGTPDKPHAIQRAGSASPPRKSALSRTTWEPRSATRSDPPTNICSQRQ